MSIQRFLENVVICDPEENFLATTEIEGTKISQVISKWIARDWHVQKYLTVMNACNEVLLP